jgi:hypothetical protein
MKRNLILFVVLLLIGIGIQAQPDLKHSIYFKDKNCNVFFNTFGRYMYGHTNGNVYALYVKSNNGTPRKDSYLAKLNAQFDTVWTRKYSGSEDDELYFIREMPNGNLLLAGHTSSHDGDVWYGHTYSAREIWILEVDTLGNTIKGKTFGGGNGSELTDIIMSIDGYIYLAGNTIANDYDFACVNYGSLDASAWVAKYDSAFNKVWINMYIGDGDDGWPTIKEVTPSRLMLGYGTNSMSAEADPVNAKGMFDLMVQYIDSAGNTIWKKRQGSADDDASRKSVIDPITKDVYFVGTSWHLGAQPGNVGTASGDINYKSGTIWVHKIDTLGNIKGSKAYGAASDITYIVDASFFNGCVYVFGYSQGGGGDMDSNVGFPGTENAWIGMIDSNVNLVGKSTIQTYYSDDIANSFIQNGQLLLTCRFYTYTNQYKCDTTNWTSIIFNIGKSPLGIEEQYKEKVKLFELSPNPAYSTFNIQIQEPYRTMGMTLQVKSMDGRMVYHAAIDSKATINCSDWHSGLYTISIFSEDGKSQTQLFRKE